MRARLSFALLLGVAWAVAAGAQVDQRPGTDGVIGRDYKINRDYPLQFVLEKVEYTIDRVRFGEQSRACKAEEKLMVVRFSVQNATKEEALFRYDSIAMTAVDDQQQNYEYRGEYAADGTGQVVDLNLKPAQKIRCYTVVVVPAKARINKLMVLPYEDDAPVIRYALDGKIGRLPEPHADPDDKSGLTPRDELSAKVGEWQTIGLFDVRVDASAPSTETIADTELPEDKAWHAITLTLRNATPEVQVVNGHTLAGVLALADETELDEPLRVMPKAPKMADFQVPPGAERAVRLFFPLGKGDKPAMLRVRGLCIVDATEGESRPVAVTLPEPPAG